MSLSSDDSSRLSKILARILLTDGHERDVAISSFNAVLERAGVHASQIHVGGSASDVDITAMVARHLKQTEAQQRLHHERVSGLLEKIKRLEGQVSNRDASIRKIKAQLKALQEQHERVVAWMEQMPGVQRSLPDAAPMHHPVIETRTTWRDEPPSVINRPTWR